ncbi:MAG: galactokinase [Bacteroidota bacterium]
MIDIDALGKEFRDEYGTEPRFFGAPGRVNLIGEHTDYNDGFVMPLAIDRRTVVAAAPRNDRVVRVRSLNLGEMMSFDLDTPGGGRRDIWLDYIEGVARVCESRGFYLRGADMTICSDVPEGAGLSSSAALEISSALAMASISGFVIDPVKMALIGQQAEHQYVGTMCGIMDQYVAALGEAGHALLIDCRSLEYTPIAIDTSDIAIAICDTGVKHSLASSEYNTRRRECERGVGILREWLPGITALRDVTMEQLELHRDKLPEPIRSRCRHVITENARTRAASEALLHRDFATMGRLMAESHRSLRDDYEVSCMELDLMVELAAAVDGTVGARMTGGGFGGSTVNIVRRESLRDFREIVGFGYAARTGHAPAIYISEIGDGAREIVINADGGAG